MPQSLQNVIFNQSANECIPLYGENDTNGALQLPVNLAPASQFPAGTLLGAVTGSANDVQTLTCTGTPTGGTQTFAVIDQATGIGSNLVVPFNSSSSGLQTLVNAIFGAGNVTASGGPWPGTPLVLTFTGILAGLPIPVLIPTTNALTGGSTPAATVAHTTVGVTASTYKTYASGNSDGSQFPVCALRYDCTTDASGRIVFAIVPTSATTPNLGGQWGESHPDAPAWFRGTFLASKILGLDANAIPLVGRLYQGIVSAPVVIRFS